MELDDFEAYPSMVAANLGLSIVPATCVSIPTPMPVRRIPLGDDAPGRQLGLAGRADPPPVRMPEVIHGAIAEAVGIGTLSVDGAGVGP